MKQPHIKQLHIVLVLAALLGGMAAAPVMAAEPVSAEPVSIVAIDTRSGVVTVQNAATGRSYQVKVGDSGTLSALKVGQKLNAEISAAKVTLRPAEPVTAIRGRQIKAITGTIVGQTDDLQSSAQPISSGGGPLKPGRPPTKVPTPDTQDPNGSGSRACKEAGGVWECSAIGTDPDTGEPIQSCHCRYSGLPRR